MSITKIQDPLRKDETRALEPKKATGELKDAMHTMCAFLNTFGGRVLFSITPSYLQIIGQLLS